MRERALLEFGPEGQVFAEAWVLVAEARKHLSASVLNAAIILGLSRGALGHAQGGHLLSTDPAERFLAARIEDAKQFADALETGGASRGSLVTLLLSIEFILRAAQYQASEKASVPEAIATAAG